MSRREYRPHRHICSGVKGRDEGLVEGELDVSLHLRSVLWRVVGTIAVNVLAVVIGGNVRGLRECELVLSVDLLDVHRGIGFFLVLGAAGQVDTLELCRIVCIGMGPERPAVFNTSIGRAYSEFEEVTTGNGEVSFDVDLRVVTAFRGALVRDCRIGDRGVEYHVGPADRLSGSVPDGPVVASAGDGDREIESQG